MDKAEYKIATEHIKKLISQGEYAEASHIADTIEWRRVKSVMMLCTVSDLYKVNRRYEDAKELLYMAYERNPESRTILYSLCDLSIKLEEFVAAIEYYKSFVEVAPRDTGRYVLQYRLYQAQDVSLEERIEVLEQLKSEEYIEKWAYELAYLYHRIGFATKCVEECDELILWFGKGRYVYKAMELKMLHEPLSPSQQYLYDRRFEHLEQAKDLTRVLPRIDSGESDMTHEGMVDVTDAPTVEIPQAYLEKELHEEVEEIQVKTLDVANAYNTMNLQRELAASLREILDVSHTESSVDTSIAEVESGYTDTAELNETVSVEESTDVVEEEPEKELESNDFDETEEVAGTVAIPDVEEKIVESVVSEVKEPVIWVEPAEVAEADQERLIDEPVAEEEVFEEKTEEVVEETKITAEEESKEEVVNVSPEVFQEEALDEEDKHVASNAATLNLKRYQKFVRSVETEVQIMNVLDNASMTATVGNISVTGHDLGICFDFIKVLLSDLKKQGFNINGKTAKISAVNLNKKEPSEIISKVQGGILIIERAGRLRRNVVEKLIACLQTEISEVLVFMADTKQGMNRFFDKNADMQSLFNLRVDIKDYTSDELVEHGVKYALDQEYSIDEMGLLALRTRIEEMIANDDALTLEDAQGIVDEAIEHADRKNFKHFMDILLHKRYDEEDMIILREEDFLVMN